MGVGVIVIELAGEPKGKGRPRFARATGRAYTPAATRDYETNLRYAAQVAMDGRAPLEEALIVTVWAHMPVPSSWSRKRREAALSGTAFPTKKPDADNIIKVLDSLNEVVWKDDKQIVDCRVVKLYSERPALRIEVAERLRSVPGKEAA